MDCLGVCKKCNVVMVSSMFLRSEKPELGVDFIVDYNNNESGKGKNENKKQFNEL